MKPYCLEVSGPFACFTRPEMKVERVSYDVPTPSAVRAVFEAIFWKPAVRWQPTRIDVLAPIKMISVRRNELGVIMSPESSGLFIEDHRQQRAGLFLRDVRYRFYAVLEYIPVEQRRSTRLTPLPQALLDGEETSFQKEEEELFRKSLDRRADETPGKYLAMFERRARKGQCFTRPYLGCREFSCNFRLVEKNEPPAETIAESRDLGWMLYDLDFSNPEDPQPMFFHAFMKNGTVAVPLRDGEEVKR